MNGAVLWAAGGTGFTFLLTSLGAATVFLFRRELAEKTQTAFFGFAAGVMLAAAVWSMLLPSVERAEALGFPGWLPPVTGFPLGVGMMIALDRLAARLRGRPGERRELLFLAITLHNIPEGMAVGLAFALAAGQGGDPALLASATALAVGIGIQNFPEGAALALPIWQESGRPGLAFRRGVLSGAVEPLAGVTAALLAGCAAVLMPWLLAVAAGAMLYVVVEEMLPEASSRTGTLAVMFGFLLMMTLDVVLG